MKTIYKYKLEGRYTSALDLPLGAVVVDAAMQQADIYIWALVDTDAATEKRYFQVVGTGWEIDGDVKYIAAVHDQMFVWHVVEVV